MAAAILAVVAARTLPWALVVVGGMAAATVAAGAVVVGTVVVGTVAAMATEPRTAFG
jgi:hypothetical protein